MKYLIVAAICVLASCQGYDGEKKSIDSTNLSNANVDSAGSVLPQPDSLPVPFATKSVQAYCEVISRPANQIPQAPAGFIVTRFIEGLDNPRFIYAADNGDIFVAEANTEIRGLKKVAAAVIPNRKVKSQHLGMSANRVTLLRGGLDGTPVRRYTFLEGLDRPFGITVIGNKFYVANTDGLVAYDYTPGDTMIRSAGKKIVSLPAGGYNNHWTRNILTNQEKTKIYISVGSGSNVAEHGILNEVRRADILEVNPDGTGERIVASGLRNPAGLSFQPDSKLLWAAVNERDELGDELVPDYITSVKDNGFYGWPYFYYGKHPDPRMKGKPVPKIAENPIVPDFAVGAHTASLGLTFYTGNTFPARYRHGAFVGQHGSWNRSILSGYKVSFVPFANGRPSGKMEDFLTGFIANEDKRQVYGRPVGMAVLKDGSLLLADDAGNTIWKISYPNK